MRPASHLRAGAVAGPTCLRLTRVPHAQRSLSPAALDLTSRAARVHHGYFPASAPCCGHICFRVTVFCCSLVLTPVPVVSTPICLSWCLSLRVPALPARRPPLF